MTSLFARVPLLVAGLLLLLTIFYRTFLFHDDDPYRCSAVLNTGHWGDEPDEDGIRYPYEKWRVDGCMFHQYTSEEIRQCFQGRDVTFTGDSTTRGIYYGLARLLNRPLGKALKREMASIGKEELHKSHNVTIHGIRMQHYWNEYLVLDGAKDKRRYNDSLKLIRHDRENVASGDDLEGAVLAFVGVGPWFSTPRFVENSCNGSSEVMLDLFKERLGNVSDVVGPNVNDMITAPMDSVEGIGDRLFFAPPAGPYYSGNQPEYIDERGRAGENVKMMQKWLHHVTDDDLNFERVWSYFPLVDGNPGTIIDPNWSGWHAIDSVNEAKANILLNMRCNAKLDRLKGYPYTRTCCTDYGNKPTAQLGLVLIFIAYLAVCVLFEFADLVFRPKVPLWGFRLFSMKTGAFAVAVLLCYYADRTHLFAKGEKNWSYQDFLLFLAPCLLIAIVSVRRSAAMVSKMVTLDPIANSDQPFLSRDQTEEWKGWMQVAILIYHWTAAGNSQGIYVLIRVLVAAYLFQTGYGHTTYFLKKKDFSFKRVASVLLRLNLLPCSLAYVMNTDYMFYYFSPLCSFWFIMVYLTLAIGHKYNDDTQIVLAKICISAVFVTFVIRGASIFQWAFVLLKYVFQIQWSISEWEYRVSLDSIIVYVGMLMAIAYMKLEDDIRAFLRHTMALAGVLAIAGYWYTSSEMSVDEYRTKHPYFSFVPILAFIAIRNVSGRARNYYSTAMAWLGKCSLETYTLQFHIFLAADTYGVLLLDVFKGEGEETILYNRWKSLVFIVPMFLWVSSITAQATTSLVEIILSPVSFEYQPVAAAAKSEHDLEYQPVAVAARDEPDLESRQDDVEFKDQDGEGSEQVVEKDEQDIESCEDIVVFKDQDDDGDGDQSAGLLHRSRRSIVSNYTKSVRNVQAILCSIHLRIIVILAVMFILNLLYPVLDPHIPDGYTSPHFPGFIDSLKEQNVTISNSTMSNHTLSF